MGTEGLRRVRLTVAYDGAPFHGFAENVGVRTVMGTLRAAVQMVTQTDVALTGAGRTDAGVHGWGQVISGDIPASTDLAGLRSRLNQLCAPSIAVRDAQWAEDPQFNARFSATWRRYRYHVLNHPVPNPLAPAAWHVSRPLRVWAMNAACDALLGEHDFSAFCRRPKVEPDEPPKSLVRRVADARWTQLDDDERPGLLRFEIQANAFCHQMVRSIVGCLVRVGSGALTPADVRGILLAGDRSQAGTIAPPHGLCLWAVGYGEP